MNFIKTLTTAFILAAATALSSVALADEAKLTPSSVADTTNADMTNAEVRKVDKDSKKITLKHEAIKNLDMPGMTMVFQVKNATLLDNVKAGDKVKVRVISERGAYIVTEIRADK
jgi:Cu(I)/Ag(I) efflux system periplasmic protein CusF